MDLRRIPPQPADGLVHLIIEIPGGSRNKYEMDKDLGVIKLDRVLYSSVQYPYDYGFIPNTLGEDGDPLDGLVMMDEPTFPGCLVVARPIGMLEMVDQGERDEKLLCVPADDPRYASYKSLSDVPAHRLAEIAEFFRTYKNLENKKVDIGEWKDVYAVKPLIAQAIAAYQKQS
ncbi:MAG: inorganic diphosphatase [Gloeomargarita sp. GMQP_bins_120]